MNKKIEAFSRGISPLHGEDFLDIHAAPISEGLLHLQTYIQGLMKGEIDKTDYHRLAIIQGQLGDISRISYYKRVSPESPRCKGEGAMDRLRSSLGGLIIHTTFLAEIFKIDLWKATHDELERLDNQEWRKT